MKEGSNQSCYVSDFSRFNLETMLLQKPKPRTELQVDRGIEHEPPKRGNQITVETIKTCLNQQASSQLTDMGECPRLANTKMDASIHRTDYQKVTSSTKVN